MLNSPLAAATRARVYHQRTRVQPPERGLQVLGMLGALFVHLIFLLGFVLGPAFEPTLPPPPPKEELLQIRMIEPPPPPPPVHGTSPKERGPRHQGRRSPAVIVHERSANVEAVSTPTPPLKPSQPKSAPPSAAAAVKTATTQPKRKPALATPKPVAAPISLKQVAPPPVSQPRPPAGEPPALAIPTAKPSPPVPPKLQPEPVRAPQVEGNRPLLPPMSLTMPSVPQPPSPVDLPSMPMHVDMPKMVAPISVAPVTPQPAAAPQVPKMQPLPLPARPSPPVNLQPATIAPLAASVQMQADAPVPAEAEVPLPAKLAVPVQAPVQPAAIILAPPQLQAAAPSTVEAPAVPLAIAQTPVELAPVAPQPSVQRAKLQPELSTPVTVASVVPPTEAAASPSAPAAKPASTEPTPAPKPAPQAGETNGPLDVSRAPDATPQGSDDAVVGGAADVVTATPVSSASHTLPTAVPGQGNASRKPGKLQGAGKIGGDQPGAGKGEKHGSLDDYVQLKPHGDTKIMRHRAPNIGYQPTRFDQAWTPEGESSIDTAVRHAVEKTTLKHTFHLPLGIRVECVVRPLLPNSLFGCQNPDPPANRLPDKIYDRLNVPPASPLAPPAAAASTAKSPAPMIKVDNSAECAAARLTGGPLPPGCESDELPLRPIHAPASSSSSWVPASDQFH